MDDGSMPSGLDAAGRSRRAGILSQMVGLYGLFARWYVLRREVARDNSQGTPVDETQKLLRVRSYVALD